jgi:mannosyltransferase
MVGRFSSDANVVVETPRGAVWASPIQPWHGGVGVLQRQLYSRLFERGFRVVSSGRSGVGPLRVMKSLAEPVGSSYAAALVCTTPAPAVLRAPTIAFVYDLRWRRTRSVGGRLYRFLDLSRTIAKARQVFAISERTSDELVGLFPEAREKCTVLHLGPGILKHSDFTDGEPGAVVLVGRRRHKRNEIIAEALARGRPDWATRFLCVGVSDTTFRTLTAAFGSVSCERFDGVDDDLMRALFQRAQVYITASVEEGFGLPMVEALTAGCQVVAIRQPLTEEILGDAAVLIDDGDVHTVSRQLRDPAWVAPDTRRSRSSMFSWDRVADMVAGTLSRVMR